MQVKLFAHILGMLLLAATVHATSANAGIDIKTPTLRIWPFASLDFPKQVSKDLAQKWVQASAEQLIDLAFVDLGANSDYMHVHVLFKSDSVYAVLLHTQEYPTRTGYIAKDGHELDRLDRNWIIWPRQGLPIEDANHYLSGPKAGKGRPLTINPDDLDPILFGVRPSTTQYSFYFYRYRCEDAGFLSVQQFAESSLIEVNLRGEKICLDLVNGFCRNNSSDPKCSGATEVESYYPR